MIEIRSLAKDYYIDKKPFRALSNINLSFPSQQFVSVLGPSGCGKTTLLNVLGGLDSITEGDIIINGQSLKKMNSQELDSYRNNEIGFVYQQYILIPQLTVIENIEVALAVRDYSDAEVKEKALKALDEVGLKDIAKKKPNQLSGGQAQRVAIARAIVTDPSVILADEPTGSLDSENSRLIMELLEKVAKNRLVIVVTHNEELAKAYSERIIRLKDGEVQSDTLVSPLSKEIENNARSLKRSHLSFKMIHRLAFKNIFSKRIKSILTSIANSFGVIGIAFFLAINFGFSNYNYRLSSETASSLPVVITSYNAKTSSDAYGDYNSSTLYPDTDEIYPKVTVNSETTYTYNNFSSKYFSYLNTLQDEGLIKNYLTSYGNNYSFNLVTEYPDSIDGNTKGGYDEVYTPMRNYNSSASSYGLPDNIFHVLYGNLDQYDVIYGNLPTNENEMVLVVDKYNSVSFNILRQLGFYNYADTQDEVEDASLSTKVKPIKFTDLCAKEYKVFSNDDYFSKTSTETITDGTGLINRTVNHYSYDLSEDFYKNNGISLKITGVIRAKEGSSLNILSPSLCYSSSLQEKLVSDDINSSFSKDLPNHMVFTNPDESLTPVNDFISSLETIITDYQTSKESSSLPTTEINSLLTKYFKYYSPFGNTYAGFSTFLSDAQKFGSEVISDEIKNMDLNDSDQVSSFITTLSKEFLSNTTQAYNDLIGLVAYMNAFSVVKEVVIFTPDLTNREKLLTKLDEFNEIQTDSDSHASSTKEQVFYSEENDNWMIKDVGEMVSLVSMILIIFAVVSLTVSCAMTALLTSNNVLERKTEIGLLRSLGARKSDVAMIFEIEAFYIAAFSGLLGSLLTYCLSFPINALINSYYSYYKVGVICDFTWWHLLIVLGISIVVGLLSALIPAIKAARENPVDCIRSQQAKEKKVILVYIITR